MSLAKNDREFQPAADRKSPAGGNIRGADALVRIVTGGGAGRPVAGAGRAPSPDRKTIKKAGGILKEAVEALESRRYKRSEILFDEGMALLEEPPPRLWCYRLVAAAKAANYEYVVDNYKRIRALASCEEEEVMVDRVWIDCLVAAGLYELALQEVETLSSRSAGVRSSTRTVVGVIQARLGRFDEAIATQKSILAEDPSHILARWNLAMHQLQAGQLPEAFENYEARWRWTDFPSEHRTFDIPRWQGQDPEGKRILVWREQGVGDEIRFSGVLPDLVAAGARVTFECSPKLVALFRSSFTDVEVRPEPPVELRKAQDYLDFDFEVPVGSLARHFRPTVAAMREKCRPWLKRDARIENEVRADMKVTPQQPVIGLSWRSTNRNLLRNRNFIAADYLAPLRLLGGAKFLCVQYDECRDEVDSLRQMGMTIYDFPNVDQTNDLVSASYLLGACDMVVTVGTATAQLSAGLGVPTVMFGLAQSDVMLGTDGVPWHPATHFVPLNPDDPIGVAKSILFDWSAIAAWAEKASISGRPTDWRLSFPGAA